MTFNEEIVAMRARIAKAEAERDTWRTSGMQEKYLEAYSALEALELQLEALRQQGLRNTARVAAAEAAAEDAVDYARLQCSLAPAERLEAADALPAPGGLDVPDETGRELMATLGITFQEGVYRLGEYRYDRLADAVNYARLRRLHARADRRV